METTIDLSESSTSAANLLQRAAATLNTAGVEAPRLNAEVLLAAAWSCTRTVLLSRLQGPLPADVESKFDDLLRRRRAREPLQYIVGATEFWSLDFDLTPDVLIPRPETERLVELVLSLLRNGSLGSDALRPSICDVGTGSGCIAIALAHEAPAARVTALDVSAAALRVAESNAARNRLAGRIRFLESNLFAAASGERFDIIVSNPPYVATPELDTAQAELRYEPRRALDGGGDGLDVIRVLLRDAPQHLRAGGWLFMEIGCDQSAVVVALARTAGAQEAEVFNDYAGLPRVLRARW
ncbi:MAG: peptide chain release factor N(5)-glutamine methyltransferase [Deltaproteobacteria bacterium]|nr:peptide chain release factor N(5)-glutamine methyltransferase [Deltaproteobacteria bacterium]